MTHTAWLAVWLNVCTRKDEFTNLSNVISLIHVQGYPFHPFFIDLLNKCIKYISEKQLPVNLQITRIHKISSITPFPFEYGEI